MTATRRLAAMHAADVGLLSLLGQTSPFQGKGWKVCNRRIFPVASVAAKSRLTEPLADAQFQQRERVFVPLNRRCRWDAERLCWVVNRPSPKP
jgi:hypothetical protein